jgi:hypothetical protein
MTIITQTRPRRGWDRSPVGIPCKPQCILYTTADPMPWFAWNRYNSTPVQTIGIGIKAGRRRCLSIRWGRPS